ncbi:prolyl 3-hydroxylase 1 isoform X2 [Lasioglossum baleicum]|uniref:prolyl 3-hydroxylase 1 isoform X2 n=1 Tax=Lasioglossum baleicum TaxID=434251 RepID=UPI003FCEB019
MLRDVKSHIPQRAAAGGGSRRVACRVGSSAEFSAKQRSETRCSTTMRFFVLILFFCGTIAGNNDTLFNEIRIDDPADPIVVPELDLSVTDRTLHEIYYDAVQAYLDEDWDRCVENFNQVWHGYKVYKRMVVNCRKKCRAKANSEAPIFPENIEDLHFYERKIVETLCLLTCNQEYLEIAGDNALKTLPRETESKLTNYHVYEYLHICYFKKQRYKDAADAVFTFLVRHPKHEMSIKALKHYLMFPGVETQNIVNLEAAPYVSIYFKGVLAYEDANYAEAVALFEASLASYLQAEEECRFYCEGPFDQGWHPEFTSSIANHFTFCLKCKQICHQRLNNINGDYRGDMLKSHYDYLQFAYYKLRNLKAACNAVGTYLLFDPVHETMLQNRKYYSTQPMVKEQYFQPRKEALAYVKRHEYELTLLRYISDEFSVVDRKFADIRKKHQARREKTKEKPGQKIEEVEALHPPPGHSFSNTLLFNNLSAIQDEKHAIPDRKPQRVRDDISVVAEAKELGGKNRYVADGFLNSTECELLMRLASMTAVEGDGYNEYKSPHSKYERFEGITVGRVALMVYLGQIESERLRQLLETTEEARSHVERYFGLDRALHVTYTHLVCRTALPGWRVLLREGSRDPRIGQLGFSAMRPYGGFLRRWRESSWCQGCCSRQTVCLGSVVHAGSEVQRVREDFSRGDLREGGFGWACHQRGGRPGAFEVRGSSYPVCQQRRFPKGVLERFFLKRTEVSQYLQYFNCSRYLNAVPTENLSSFLNNHCR